MAITKNAARQDLIMAYVDINLADLTSGVAAAALNLPVGAVITSGELVTTEAWNSTSTDVMTVGDVTTTTRYLTNGNIRALAANVALVPTGFVQTSTQPTLNVIWTSGGGTPTTGKVRLQVRYFIKGREKFSEG